MNINTLGNTSFTEADPVTMKALLDAHYNQELSIYDYWGIGDERKIMLGGEIDQEIQMVLTDKNHFALENGMPAAFVCSQKNVLARIVRPMNMTWTNKGGWEECDMRTFCNREYANAFPEEIRSLFKRFYTDGKKNKVVDQFALHSEYELFGENIYSKKSEKTEQLEYYKLTRNRVKCEGDDYGKARWYWERSPYSGNTSFFCFVYSTGNANSNLANGSIGIAPFGCL